MNVLERACVNLPAECRWVVAGGRLLVPVWCRSAVCRATSDDELVNDVGQRCVHIERTDSRACDDNNFSSINVCELTLGTV